MTSIALIGGGYWGEKLLRNFVQVNGAKVMYCCDLQDALLEKAKRSYPSITTTKEYAEVLNSDVDAVVIATPVATHFRLAQQALLKGKHVFVEKPMTNSSSSAFELVRLAQQNNRVLMVDHTFEYAPAINRMKQVVESGELGEIFYLRANWLNLGLLQPDVNVIWDLGVHIFSIIHYILQEYPVSVKVDAQVFVRKSLEETATLTLKFKDKKIAIITLSWLEPKKVREFAIIGSKKMVLYDLMNFTEQVKIYEGGVDQVTFDANPSGFIYRTGDIQAPNIQGIEPLFESCKHFVQCIIEGRKPRSDGIAGAAVVRLLEAADESLRNKGVEVMI